MGGQNKQTNYFPSWPCQDPTTLPFWPTSQLSDGWLKVFGGFFGACDEKPKGLLNDGWLKLCFQGPRNRGGLASLCK